jgi:hypothetical protein
MRSKYVPHVEAVEIVRPYVIRVTFDDGLVRELEFIARGHGGTVFAPLDDPDFFAQVEVDPISRTIVWPGELDFDPAVLHGDYEPAGGENLFRDVTPAADRARSR